MPIRLLQFLLPRQPYHCQPMTDATLHIYLSRTINFFGTSCLSSAIMASIGSLYRSSLFTGLAPLSRCDSVAQVLHATAPDWQAPHKCNRFATVLVPHPLIPTRYTASFSDRGCSDRYQAFWQPWSCCRKPEPAPREGCLFLNRSRPGERAGAVPTGSLSPDQGAIGDV